MSSLLLRANAVIWLASWIYKNSLNNAMLIDHDWMVGSASNVASVVSVSPWPGVGSEVGSLSEDDEVMDTDL
jgi:hypothetical protein